jgi:hypothetical protein
MAFLSLDASALDQELPKLENYLDPMLSGQASILYNIFKLKNEYINNIIFYIYQLSKLYVSQDFPFEKCILDGL